VVVEEMEQQVQEEEAEVEQVDIEHHFQEEQKFQ
jgi:hypothetical protein